MAVPHRLGYAKVALGSLRFIDCLNREDGQEQALPQLDERNVTRLESIFRLAGPSRGEKRNFIRAVAQRSAVQDRLTPEIPTADDVIAVGLPLRCLRGKHRAEAGTRTLAAADQWWVVEVFDEETPLDVQWRIATDQSSDRGPHDGFVYAQLQAAVDAESRDEWLSRLTAAGRRDYSQLCKARNRHLKDALDSLLPFPGLWQPFSFGIVQRLTKMRCAEELAQYLSNVRRTWSMILLDRSELYGLLDARTVSLVELHAPARASDDAASLTRLMGKRQLFPAIVDIYTRQAIETTLMGAKARIPSLRSFLEDTKYLMYGADILKRLLPHKPAGSTQIRTAYQDMYNGDDFAGHYCKVWLLALANFRELLPVTTKKDVKAAKPSHGRVTGRPWQSLACEASSLGFTSAPISELQEEDMERAAALEILQRFHPDVDHSSLVARVTEIAEILKRPSHQRGRTRRTPEIGSDHVPLPLNRRCGIPHATSFNADRLHFAEYVLVDLDTYDTLYVWPSTFAIMRSLIRCFLVADDEILERRAVPAIEQPGIGQSAALLRSSSMYSEQEEDMLALTAQPHNSSSSSIDPSVREEPLTLPTENGVREDLGPMPGTSDISHRKRKRRDCDDNEQSYDMAIDQLIAHLPDCEKVYYWSIEDKTLYVCNTNQVDEWGGYIVWVLGPQGLWAHPNPRRALQHIIRCGRLAVAVPRGNTSPPNIWHDVLQFFQLRDRLVLESANDVLRHRVTQALRSVVVPFRAIRLFKCINIINLIDKRERYIT